MNPQPNVDGCALEEGEVVGGSEPLCGLGQVASTGSLKPRTLRILEINSVRPTVPGYDKQ